MDLFWEFCHGCTNSIILVVDAQILNQEISACGNKAENIRIRCPLDGYKVTEIKIISVSNHLPISLS